jgi:hypothetical protein
MASEEVQVLESTAADTTNNPNIPLQFRGKGGGTQFFTQNPESFRRSP